MYTRADEDGVASVLRRKGRPLSAIASSQSPPFTVTVVPDRREVVVIPAGDLDLATVDRLDREIRELRAVGFDHVVLDLRQLEFLDSSGLRLLLSLRNTAKRAGHRLELVPGVSPVQRVFELTATRSLFDWREDRRRLALVPSP